MRIRLRKIKTSLLDVSPVDRVMYLLSEGTNSANSRKPGNARNIYMLAISLNTLYMSEKLRLTTSSLVMHPSKPND